MTPENPKNSIFHRTPQIRQRLVQSEIFVRFRDAQNFANSHQTRIYLQRGSENRRINALFNAIK